MEKKSKWQRYWQWSLYVIAPLIVISVFIWQLDNLENFFEQYPYAIDGGTSVFVLFTTTLSIIIAYKSYRNSVGQEVRAENKKSNLLKRSLNRKTQKLRTKINVVNLEYAVKHEIEGIDLLYQLMKDKDTRIDIRNFKNIIEKELSDNPTDFTESDEEMISDRIRTLENLEAMVGVYFATEGKDSDKPISYIAEEMTLKKYIQTRIDKVTHSFK